MKGDVGREGEKGGRGEKGERGFIGEKGRKGASGVQGQKGMEGERRNKSETLDVLFGSLPSQCVPGNFRLLNETWRKPSEHYFKTMAHCETTVMSTVFDKAGIHFPLQ